MYTKILVAVDGGDLTRGLRRTRYSSRKRRRLTDAALDGLVAQERLSRGVKAVLRSHEQEADLLVHIGEDLIQAA